jgi:TolA-binding protein
MRAGMSPLHIAASVLAALAVLAAGCGGPQAVSSAELVQKGDEICSQGRERFADIQTEPPANASEAADQTTDLIDVSDDELSDLRGLEPPDQQRAAYNRYLEARQRAIDLLKQGEGAAERQDGDAYAAAQTAMAKAAPARQRLAQALGLKVCSKPSAP